MSKSKAKTLILSFLSAPPFHVFVSAQCAY